jgi:putative acetyltransferase
MTASTITIREAKLSDLPSLQQLFVGTIETICKADYNDQQISVWTASIENKQRWLDIIENQYVLIAQERDGIIGFCSLDKNNYIDLFYVHKDKQGQGIARLLYNNIESEAIKFGQKELTSDVSITARPFFEKMGFAIQAEQTVVRHGVELTNYKMKKRLT